MTNSALAHNARRHKAAASKARTCTPALLARRGLIYIAAALAPMVWVRRRLDGKGRPHPLRGSPSFERLLCHGYSSSARALAVHGHLMQPQAPKTTTFGHCLRETSPRKTTLYTSPQASRPCFAQGRDLSLPHASSKLSAPSYLSRQFAPIEHSCAVQVCFGW